MQPRRSLADFPAARMQKAVPPLWPDCHADRDLGALVPSLDPDVTIRIRRKLQPLAQKTRARTFHSLRAPRLCVRHLRGSFNQQVTEAQRSIRVIRGSIPPRLVVQLAWIMVANICALCEICGSAPIDHQNEFTTDFVDNTDTKQLRSASCLVRSILTQSSPSPQRSTRSAIGLAFPGFSFPGFPLCLGLVPWWFNGLMVAHSLRAPRLCVRHFRGSFRHKVTETQRLIRVIRVIYGSIMPSVLYDSSCLPRSLDI